LLRGRYWNWGVVLGGRKIIGMGVLDVRVGRVIRSGLENVRGSPQRELIDVFQVRVLRIGRGAASAFGILAPDGVNIHDRSKHRPNAVHTVARVELIKPRQAESSQRPSRVQRSLNNRTSVLGKFYDEFPRDVPRRR